HPLATMIGVPHESAVVQIDPPIHFLEWNLAEQDLAALRQGQNLVMARAALRLNYRLTVDFHGHRAKHRPRFPLTMEVEAELADQGFRHTQERCAGIDPRFDSHLSDFLVRKLAPESALSVF